MCAPRGRSHLGRGRAAYTSAIQNLCKQAYNILFSRCAHTTEFAKFLVAMRLGDTPVPIPNTMVKT